MAIYVFSCWLAIALQKWWSAIAIQVSQLRHTQNLHRRNCYILLFKEAGARRQEAQLESP
ncbi:MAG: hypothetical protein ACYTXC_16275 [Nostoc sp.]